MKIIKWKVSKIQIIKEGGLFYAKGIIIACCDNLAEYSIPYGANGQTQKAAYEKAVSEMCERGTWFFLYSMYPYLFPNTKGFAAHIDSSVARLNSIREYFERKLLEMICLYLDSEDMDNLYKVFSVTRNNEQFIFSCYSKEYATYFVFAFIEHTYMRTGINQNGLVVGMGKSGDYPKAYSDSLNEAKLVKTALQKVIEEGKVYSERSVLKGEVKEYLGIFYNKQYRSVLHNLKNNTAVSDAADLVKAPCTKNLSGYVPRFLKKFERSIYYSTDQEEFFSWSFMP